MSVILIRIHNSNTLFSILQSLVARTNLEEDVESISSYPNSDIEEEDDEDENEYIPPSDNTQTSTFSSNLNLVIQSLESFPLNNENYFNRLYFEVFEI